VEELRATRERLKYKGWELKHHTAAAMASHPGNVT
jgi:hypothetical protein